VNDESAVDYNSEDFHKGYNDGHAGLGCCPEARKPGSVEFASYMEGWLVGDSERLK
jgi:hypothetical protein